MLICSNLILFDFSKRNKISSFLKGSITFEPKDALLTDMEKVRKKIKMCYCN